MNIELGYAIYVSLVCTFFGWLQYGMYGFRLVEPIICGPLVGLFLGDIQKRYHYWWNFTACLYGYSRR